MAAKFLAEQTNHVNYQCCEIDGEILNIGVLLIASRLDDLIYPEHRLDIFQLVCQC